MEMGTVLEVASFACGILGLTSGGILFYKANRLKADSEGRQSKAQAELEEANVYKARIKSLGEEVEILEAKVKNLRLQLDEMTAQRDKYQALSSSQELTIEQLNQMIAQRERQNEELIRANRALKRQVTRLKNQNDKENIE